LRRLTAWLTSWLTPFNPEKRMRGYFLTSHLTSVYVVFVGYYRWVL
jgi:hypothetical protein